MKKCEHDVEKPRNRCRKLQARINSCSVRFRSKIILETPKPSKSEKWALEDFLQCGDGSCQTRDCDIPR